MKKETFDNKYKKGEVEEVKKTDEKDSSKGVDTSPKIEDYLTFLENIRQFKGFVAVAPAHTPKSFLDQIVFYSAGGEHRVYFYVNAGWHYVEINHVTPD